MKLSIVIPCYNEEGCINKFYDAVHGLSLPCKVEFWFIDDGSRDGTLEECKLLTSKDNEVHYISFSRNFGKESALLAGLRHVTGDYVVTMDADLQHPPELLPDMLKEMCDGKYESIATYRVSRAGEPFLRSWLSKRFYSFMDMLSDVHLKQNACDYRIMSRKFVDAVLSLAEVNRFTKGIYSWVGFETKWIPFDNIERTVGKTKWSFWKLLKYSFEGISAFSTAPLQLASILGIILCIAAIIYFLYIMFAKVISNGFVDGYSVVVCLILSIGGINLFCIGVLGFYLSKVYSEIKHRPAYLIRDIK